MTQPSLNSTFDTSLIDLSPTEDQEAHPSTLTSSFSTTETNTSTDSKPPAEPDSTPRPNEAPPNPSSSIASARSTIQLPTTEAYDSWAATYDTDGNILQAVDDLELETLLPTFLSLLPSNNPIHIIDLGCGTGRNTAKLLSYFSNNPTAISVTGLDASAKMLSLASTKLHPTPPNVKLQLQQVDLLSPAVPAELHGSAEAVLSTLVLEHFPLPKYIEVLKALLRSGGVALVTNMHSDMGAISQAGFMKKDAEGRDVKVQGVSFVHSAKEAVEEAETQGLKVLREVGVREREVTDSMVREGMVSERGRKWVGVNVWFGMVMRKA